MERRKHRIRRRVRHVRERGKLYADVRVQVGERRVRTALERDRRAVRKLLRYIYDEVIVSDGIVHMVRESLRWFAL